MANILALEWGVREARIAVGRRRGKEIVVEQAFSVDLGPRDTGQVVAEPNIGERVAAALAARGIGRTETLVAVGRTNIELRLMAVPPSPPEELPDMVRFQAMRQFSALGEDWPLDFIPIETSDETGSKVLAAAIAPDLVQQIRKTCEAAGTTASRLVLRPFAAASLLRRRGDDGRCRLMVDLLNDEADLTVLVNQKVIFLRTVRLPASPDELAKALLGEIRRTSVAAQNQLGGRRVEQIVLFGDSKSHEDLKEQMEQELSLPVELFDPFAGVLLSPELQAREPDFPGRFAPLLGMLVDEAAGVEHAIDFLHPRKRPAPPNNRRRISLAAAMAMLIGLTIGGLVWMQLANLDKQIGSLKQRNAELERMQPAAMEQQDKAAEIDKWALGDVTWLDELFELSKKLPPAEEAMVADLKMNASRAGGGSIVLDVFVIEFKTIGVIEMALRDERREVKGTGGRGDTSLSRYLYKATETISILPEDDVAFVPSAPARSTPPRGAIRPRQAIR